MSYKAPVLLESPHGGNQTPQKVVPYSIITKPDLCADSDEFAYELFGNHPKVHELASPWWRAFLDPNRDSADMSQDGVVKTHTSQGVQIYKAPTGLPEQIALQLIRQQILPYHRRLAELLRTDEVRVLLCCHTMPAVGTPASASSSDAGKLRPIFMIGNGGETQYCPSRIVEYVRQSLQICAEGLDLEGVDYKDAVRVNNPYAGALSLGRVRSELSAGREKIGLLLEVNREAVRGRPHNIETIRAAVVSTLTTLADGLYSQL